MIRLSGNPFAYASLVCSLSHWLWLALWYFPAAPKLNFLTAGYWLAISAVAIVLAGVAAALKSKLWRLAAPLALATFFFVMYVGGS
jgi:hypothetical protein